MRKLTNPDKKEILKLYRESAETTSTLAERYGVSNSTISRLLKTTLAEDEYEYLVSLKRAARTPEGRAQVSYDLVPNFASQKEETPPPSEEINVVEPVKQVKPKRVAVEPPKIIQNKEDNDEANAIRRVKRRSSATSEEESTPQPQPTAQQLELLQEIQPQPQTRKVTSIPSPHLEDTDQQANVIAQMFGEELLDESDELDDLDDDEDFDEEDFDDDFQEIPTLVKRPRSGGGLVRVLPLSAASLPKTCYLVIDRASELITRPLRDFGELGQIPNMETQQRTLPIFDNHRVAKRFSTKRDRVIKVPDTKMLHKARYHLEAKGITRLLIDGQVYSLAPS